MARRALVYLLIPAVLLAAAGLAYYSYRYSHQVATQEQNAILDATRELAQEKILGIETELVKTSKAVTSLVDMENLSNFEQRLASERAAVESVLIVDEDWKIIPGGFFTRRQTKTHIERFRIMFEGRIAPDLRRYNARPREPSHHHEAYDGRTYLFSFTPISAGGRRYTVVVEANLTYLVGTVFPNYFDTTSPRVYQVVDERGDIIYGYAFTGVPDDEVVELRFRDTLRRWRLRVAQRAGSLKSTRDTGRVIDLVLIGTAVAIIMAGIIVLLTAARRERRANELKSEFISNVSHELKTPLSIISMFGEMLHMGRTKSPAQASEYAGIITRESTRLARLIDNVLDFARIERGADVYEFVEGDLAEVVERSLDIYRHRLERENVELVLDLPPDLPPVRMDSNAMTLALLNLVDNAIKYASSGDKLEVSLAAKDGGVALCVRDYGPGIDPEEHAHIFERFYRSRTVRLKSARGSGIGLALVKHIADAHGGRVEVDSALGQGAAFTIWIPRAEVA